MSAIRIVYVLVATIGVTLNAFGGVITGSGAGFDIPDYDDGAGATEASSDVTISENETIVDVEVTLNGLDHSWAGDLHAKISNGNTTLDLFDRVDSGSSEFEDDYTYTFSDDGESLWVAASLAAGDEIPSGDYYPTDSSNTQLFLATAFGGQSTAGTWTLTIVDLEEDDKGSLDSWDITFHTTASGGGTTATPEASSWVVFGLCLLGGVGIRRRCS